MNSSSWLSYTSGTTIASTATNGQYQFRAVDKAGNVSDTKTIYLDSAAPTGTIKNSSGTAISGYTGGAFSYTATDTGSGVSYLQYKTPGSSSWTTYSSGTTISASATNGLYQFRAVDNAGNTSAVSSIYLDTAIPTGKITDSNGTTVTTTTNKAFKYTASDGLSGIAYMQYKKPNSTVWETYAAGTLIQTTDTNGIYRFRAFDNAGNESETVMICLDTVKPTGTLYGGTSTVASGGKTNANYVKFVPSDSMSGIKSIYVQTPSSSGYESYTSGSQLAEEGTYSFYCTDAAGNFSMIYTVILDKSAPILGCLQTEFYSTYGLGFTVLPQNQSVSLKSIYRHAVFAVKLIAANELILPIDDVSIVPVRLSIIKVCRAILRRSVSKPLLAAVVSINAQLGVAVNIDFRALRNRHLTAADIPDNQCASASGCLNVYIFKNIGSPEDNLCFRSACVPNQSTNISMSYHSAVFDFHVLNRDR